MVRFALTVMMVLGCSSLMAQVPETTDAEEAASRVSNELGYLQDDLDCLTHQLDQLEGTGSIRATVAQAALHVSQGFKKVTEANNALAQARLLYRSHPPASGFLTKYSKLLYEQASINVRQGRTIYNRCEHELSTYTRNE